MSEIFPADGRPPRIFRFVEPGVLPVHNMLASLDRPTNVLRIDRALFSELSVAQQDELYKTAAPYVEVRRPLKVA